ncbi:MAG: hypothetical protein H0W81_06205 [Chloroflexi bacterium]|nr:hypothetical protein [Chloroflexota bacterium]
MNRIARPALPAALVLSLLAACSAAPGGSTGPIAHPAGDDLVLRVEFSGGMIRDFFLTGFPPFTLTGDGRVIVPGAQIDLFPGAALPAVNVRKLKENGIQAVLQEVARTGLFASSREYLAAQNFTADAGNTVFTLHAEGKDVTLTVFGLGTFDTEGNYPGVSAEELAANRTLSRLFQQLGNLDAMLPASAWADANWHPYQPEALRMLVRNADADPPDENGIGNALLDWPVESDPAAFGDPTSDGAQRCGVVSGQEAKDWFVALGGANGLSRFVRGDHRYQVTVRFQLPDELLDCPTPAI